MIKAHTQKNTLLKTAASQRCEPKFLREYFFLPPKKKFFLPSFFLFFFSHRTGTVRNTTVSASNVNRFEQSVCKLDTANLRTDSRAAANRKLNAIIFLRGLSVHQSDALRMNILQVQKMRTTLWHKCLYLFVRIFCRDCIAPKPSKKLLRQALMRWRQVFGGHCKLLTL